MTKRKLLLVEAYGFKRVTLEHTDKEFKCAFVDDSFEVGTELCKVEIAGYMYM